MKREGRRGGESEGGEGWEKAAGLLFSEGPWLRGSRLPERWGGGSGGRPAPDPLRGSRAPPPLLIPRGWDEEAFLARSLELVRVTLNWAAGLLLEENIGSCGRLPSSPPTGFPDRRQDLEVPKCGLCVQRTLTEKCTSCRCQKKTPWEVS